MSLSIKFGVHTFIWKQEFEGAEEVIFQEAYDWGFDGVEIASHLFEQIDPYRLKNYREKYGLELTFCTSLPTGLSLTSSNQEIWQESIEYVNKAIAFCQACEISHLSGPLIHPVGYLTGKPLEKAEDSRLREGLKRIAETLDKTEIKLAIEPLNRFQGYALNTVEQGLDFLQSIGSSQLGLLLDLFHMNIEEKDICKSFLKAGNSCFHIHFCAKDRGIPGSDNFNWPELIQTLSILEYQGWMVIESFNFNDPEFASAARIWRPLAESSYQIAQEGIQFLRRSFGETS